MYKMDISDYADGQNCLKPLLTHKNQEKKTNSDFFFNFLREINSKSFEICFVDGFTLSSLNGDSKRYFLTHVKKFSRQMASNML